MVKYAAMLLVVVGMLVTIDSAQARGRRGGCPGGNCYTGGYSGGCPGGVCAVGVVPAKTAAVVAEPKVVAEAAAAAAPAVAPVVATQPTPRYYTSGRRLFGRR
jgi:hypothetical protein